jgi:hypothetical protein
MERSKFQVIEQAHDKHVVIPDIHGEYSMVQKAVDRYYDDPEIGFVFLGDIVDRKGKTKDREDGVFKSVEIIRKLGNRAILLMANHEYFMHAAMFEKNPKKAREFANFWLGLDGQPSYESNTASSYGITEPDYSSPSRFLDELKFAKHDRVLTSATPYFETETFIATHAGIEPDIPLDEQKDYLETIATKMARGNYRSMVNQQCLPADIDKPPQWFSLELAVDATPIEVTDKVVVSGHAHFFSPTRLASRKRPLTFSPERSINDGKRVRLASQLYARKYEDMFVWQDWDQQIITIAREK